LQWNQPVPAAVDALNKVSVSAPVIEEYCPLARCLEARIAEAHWETSGVLPFVDSEVPYLINNSGRLSENAAAVFYAHCLSHAAALPQQIVVLECGAGTGLFARYFLDAFRTICEQESQPFYDRLLYIASDRSSATIRQWSERGIFDQHTGHVLALRGDATDLQLPAGARPRAVFCNYVLDVLPSAVLRHDSDGQDNDGMIRQLCVRTRLAGDATLLATYTHLTIDEIRERARSTDPAVLVTLLPVLSLLEYEIDMQSIGIEEIRYAPEALAWGSPNKRVVLNHGGLSCLERLFALLADDGFVLVNDYGPVTREDAEGPSSTQRFGSTTAIWLNFPLLTALLAARGVRMVEPSGDATLSIHARLLLRQPDPRTEAAFENRFQRDAYLYIQTPIEEARKHVAAGRMNDALESYKTALSRSARDWELIGEAADFVAQHLRDYPAAVELSRAALDLNPVYNTNLWNTLGDALFCMQRYDDAHQAYLQAERIDPRDIRTNLNLAYTYLHFGQLKTALDVIARGLQADKRGFYRNRLLEKQQQVLLAMSGQWDAEQQRLMMRYQRFTQG
jgi:tetratricopeptide (TPR) repeat protein